MALRLAMLKCAGEHAHGLRRWIHAVSQPPLLSSAPEIGREFHNFSFIGGSSMELMAVPKKKVSPHKRGIRNGPKALKPVPVIVRCKACGRVKLPHFFCCSGIREHTGEQNS